MYSFMCVKCTMKIMLLPIFIFFLIFLFVHNKFFFPVVNWIYQIPAIVCSRRPDGIQHNRRPSRYAPRRRRVYYSTLYLFFIVAFPKITLEAIFMISVWLTISANLWMSVFFFSRLVAKSGCDYCIFRKWGCRTLYCVDIDTTDFWG